MEFTEASGTRPDCHGSGQYIGQMAIVQDVRRGRERVIYHMRTRQTAISALYSTTSRGISLWKSS